MMLMKASFMMLKKSLSIVCVCAIAILKKYWNLGIGTALIEFAIENAKKLGYLQIELYVSVKNERAIALYEKHGFKNYGTRPRELLLDSGEFTDGYFMVLMLD